MTEIYYIEDDENIAMAVKEYLSQYLSCGSVSIDKNKTAVFCGEEESIVSQAEYQILRILMENKGKNVTRERLLTKIWDNNGIMSMTIH